MTKAMEEARAIAEQVIDQCEGCGCDECQGNVQRIIATALSAASALTAGERKPVEHQWRGKEGGVMLEKARDALETAADKILSDYRIWIADDTEAKPRYGQIPEYDMVNAVSGEIDRHLRSSALEATPPAPKVTECATEGCEQTATVRFERGGVGSDYCHDCYMRIQSLTAAQEASR